MPQQSNIVATWADTKHVHVWDVAACISALDSDQKSTQTQTIKPLHSQRHPDEGFALSWSPAIAGKLLSGDCTGNIFLFSVERNQQIAVSVDETPFRSHTGSVEDIQWSPAEPTVCFWLLVRGCVIFIPWMQVFASCSVDQTIRVWDVRAGKACMLTVKAHDADINVISWNQYACWISVFDSYFDQGRQPSAGVRLR